MRKSNRQEMVAALLAAVLLGSQGCNRERPGRPVASRGQSSEAVHTNRLITEKSPYLLQHAHNPVDWYAWGEAAFEKARQEGKPIFLSIGYSTCHWCHVMARESFEDPETARILNEHFVAIKVDREERPDVDRVYMAYVQATTGSGGWPMSVWLTPELKPFMGGTYYPPEDQLGRPGFRNVLLQTAAAWRKDRAGISASANRATRQLQQATAVGTEPGVELATALLDAGYQQLKLSYEPRYGGFSRAPKFPRPVTLNFLLRYYARTGTKDALDMSLFTLRKMAEGGMHDHLGGGFHRYSVDGAWHVPHFEKMLYDQAQLAISYLEAYQVTRDASLADVARGILEYVLRDLTGAEGQFFSAEDADSPRPANPAEHGEGAFYVWTKAEIEAALGAEPAAVFGYRYGVGSSSYLARDPQGEFAGAEVLGVRHSVEETAAEFAQPVEQTRALLARAQAQLLAVRGRRPRPQRDDKTLTAWNGLMISAFAQAAQVLDEPRYRTAAERSARFIEARLYDPQTGNLKRRYREGNAAIEGFADDYAFLIQGLLDLYETSFDVHWLTWALVLQERQDAQFWDDVQAGYFGASGQDARVILRLKNDEDGAEPSPNSVAALNLLRLSVATDNRALRERAEKVLVAFGSVLRLAPQALPQMLVAYGFLLDKPRQIVIAGQPEAVDTHALLREVHSRFIPNRVLLLADGGRGQETLAQRLGFIRDVKPQDGKATAYVCENNTCQLPTTDPAELGRQLDRIRP